MKTTTTWRTLINAAEVQTLMSAGAPLVVIDTSFDLADPVAGEESYRQGHLPNAYYLHLDRDLAGAKTGRNGRHPLPERSAFAARVGALGIGTEMQVIVYDQQAAMFAARAWWMLRWLGHDAVAVLDGGLAAWQAAGGAVTSHPPALPETNAPYPELPPLVETIDANGLAAELGRVALIDARAAERFRGEIEPLDAQAGHIPGALNRPFKDNLEPDGRFKSPTALRAAFEAIIGAMPTTGSSAAPAIVHQCGSGVTACHNLLAMAHAGWPATVLYPGSWSEWSADPARPVAQGA